jgi:alpha-amylase/alpha-mannosidase (GH57 family)
MERYLCIHCHFYQPPRENPWLEAVELQDSAYPYHDWNQRITAECYAPNSASRILDGIGRIVRIVNNYAGISFNFGPTLLSWLENRAPNLYQAIIEADRESRRRFSGHGNAMAQCYNHMIMPLSHRRDKYTQALWGVRDFEDRFGRQPEGMWLPETAVDMESLEVLAELGIKFTILAPHQARQVRKMGRGGSWKNVEGAKIDPTRAYLCKLPSGRSISIFFYDGPISRAVAFEKLLNSGETFAARLTGGFSEARMWPQLMHIATDGETYGHHHPHGDMALAYALHHIESNNLAQLTNYGDYLEKHPPTHEVEIIGNSSWSCMHGVERWRSNCGCNSGMKAGWTQEWRGPLRASLDWLRDALAGPFEEKARPLLKDPWAARDEYVEVVLARTPERRSHFLARHSARPLDSDEQTTAWKLLEMQRHAMLMYTSCGWFFDELSGIETVQVIMYAGRAIQLAQDLFDDHTEAGFLERLAEAKSNVPEHGDGARIHELWVKPAQLDLLKVGAHYAISSLFRKYEERNSVYCYDVDLEAYHSQEAGRARLAVGRARVTSQITQEMLPISFGVLHFGDHNLNAGVRPFRSDAEYERLVTDTGETFSRADLAETLRLLDRHFERTTYSLKSLFRDEQRKVLSEIMAAIRDDTEASYRQIYDNYAPLMRYLHEIGAPLPKVLQITAEFVVNSNLRRVLAEEDLDLDRVGALLDTAQRERVPLDGAGLGYILKDRVGEMMERLREDPKNLEALRRMDRVIALVQRLPFEVDLWRAQNIYWELLQNVAPEMENDRAWMESFAGLGEKLRVRVEVPVPEVPAAA